MFLQILEHPSALSEILSSFINASGGYAQLIWKLLCLPFIFLILYSTWLNQKGKNNGLGSETFFLLISALALIILRYPSYAAGELNPDEAEWIAGAATLIRDPRFWISVDGTTSGPLNIYPLCLIYLSHIKISFATTRIFCVVFLLIPAFYFTYQAIKIFYNQQVARIAIVPTILFFALTSHFDISFYSCEYVSVFLLAVVVYLYALFNKKPDLGTLIGAGLILGLLPYGKMQSLPIGAVLGLFFLIDILFNKEYTIGSKVLKILVLGLAVLIPTLVTLAYLFQFKAFDDFWQSYILNNVIYGSVVPLKNTLLALPKMVLKYTKSAIPYYVTVALVPVIGIYLLLTARNQLAQLNWKFFWYFHLIFIAAYYALGKGWGFMHYQLFIFLPLTLLNAFYFNLIKDYKQLNFSQLMLRAYALMPIILLIPGNFLIQKVLADKALPARNPASTRILKYAQPGDKLVVWGFQDVLGSNGVYYLETGLIQGTRESHSQRPEGHIGDSAQVAYYQKRFLSDIEKNQPVAIIDLGVIRYEKPSVFKAFYPELDQYIANNYTWDTVFHRMQTEIEASGRDKVKVQPLSTVVYIHNSRLQKSQDSLAVK